MGAEAGANLVLAPVVVDKFLNRAIKREELERRVVLRERVVHVEADRVDLLHIQLTIAENVALELLGRPHGRDGRSLHVQGAFHLGATRRAAQLRSREVERVRGLQQQRPQHEREVPRTRPHRVYSRTFSSRRWREKFSARARRVRFSGRSMISGLFRISGICSCFFELVRI